VEGEVGLDGPRNGSGAGGVRIDNRRSIHALLDACRVGQIPEMCVVVGKEDDSSLAERLPETFVIYKEEHPVALDRPASRTPKLAPPKRCWTRFVEKVPCIERAVAQKSI